jgi:hypothetical protein
MRFQKDTSNKFGVTATPDAISFSTGLTLSLPVQDALELAAWIVVRADPDGERFQAILAGVKIAADEGPATA